MFFRLLRDKPCIKTSTREPKAASRSPSLARSQYGSRTTEASAAWLACPNTRFNEVWNEPIPVRAETHSACKQTRGRVSDQLLQAAARSHLVGGSSTAHRPYGLKACASRNALGQSPEARGVPTTACPRLAALPGLAYIVFDVRFTSGTLANDPLLCA